MTTNEELLTKIGFSKHFGCCSNHSICQLGRLECVYEKIDPEVKNACACYQRNHSKNDYDHSKGDIKQSTSTEKNESEFHLEGNQLSFF